MIEGTSFVGPIFTVVETQLPIAPSQLVGRTCKSNEPNHPMFQVTIPVS